VLLAELLEELVSGPRLSSERAADSFCALLDSRLLQTMLARSPRCLEAFVRTSVLPRLLPALAADPPRLRLALLLLPRLLDPSGPGSLPLPACRSLCRELTCVCAGIC
jgi:hypothetical protein